MVRVCFVCLGNICRSPTAEAVMRHLVEQEGLASASRSTARARATGTSATRPIGGRARWARRAASRSSGARGSSRRPTSRASTTCSRWTAPTATSCCAWRATPAERAKVRLLRSFDPSAPPDADVPDPYYGGARGFEDVFDICEAACRGLLEHLRAQHGACGGARGADGRATGSGAGAALGGASPARAARGGDINDAFEVRLADGRAAVREDQRARAARACSRPRRGAWPGWARRARCASRPCWRRRARTSRRRSWRWSWSRPAPRARDFDERLGRGLAALHRHGAPALRPGPRQLHRPAAADEHASPAPGPSSTGCGASRRSCARGRRGAGVDARCGATSSDCSRSSTSCAGRPSRPRACTATCGAAT